MPIPFLLNFWNAYWRDFFLYARNTIRFLFARRTDDVIVRARGPFAQHTHRG